MKRATPKRSPGSPTGQSSRLSDLEKILPAFIDIAKRIKAAQLCRCDDAAGNFICLRCSSKIALKRADKVLRTQVRGEEVKRDYWLIGILCLFSFGSGYWCRKYYLSGTGRFLMGETDAWDEAEHMANLAVYYETDLRACKNSLHKTGNQK